MMFVGTVTHCLGLLHAYVHYFVCFAHAVPYSPCLMVSCMSVCKQLVDLKTALVQSL